VELVFNPPLNVAPSVADISSDAKAGRTLAPIPPLVEGGHRHTEIVGELINF